MQLGMIGLGRMGANMLRRTMRAGIAGVGHDRSPEAIATVVREGAAGAATPEELVRRLAPPRHVWLMVPAATVDAALDALVPLLSPGDVVIDGGNSLYHDDLLRADRLAAKRLHYIDCGVSGGVFGLERGFCLMVGGETDVVAGMAPIFEALAPGANSAPATPGRKGNTAERGWLHCGPHGAGHFVKMVHNAIEYGMMAAYAEGFNVLQHAGNGASGPAKADAETAPLRHPEHYQYKLPLGDIAEVWRRSSVISSWLLDLTARAFADDPQLTNFGGRVSDSGEGRWTLAAANDLGVPVHVLAASIFERFSSRGEAEFGNRLLSALRWQFGGHAEIPHA